MHPLLEDPWVAARVEDAVRPYVGKLPPSELDWMREQIAETIASDDHAADLMHRARQASVDESGEVRRGAVVTPIGAARRAGPKAAG